MIKEQVTNLDDKQVQYDLPYVGGLSQLKLFLEILNNKSKYEKYLKDITKRRDEVMELITVYDQASKIPQLKKEVEIKNEVLTKKLYDIENKLVEADNTIELANERAKAIQKDAETRAQDVRNGLDLKEKGLNSFEQELSRRQQEIAIRENQLQGMVSANGAELKRLEQLQKQAKNACDDYNNRRQQLEIAVKGM